MSSEHIAGSQYDLEMRMKELGMSHTPVPYDVYPLILRGYVCSSRSAPIGFSQESANVHSIDVSQDTLESILIT